MKTLIVVQGPTGVGKTELCLDIAEHFGVPIINADSRQIYAELPIGTAAPTAEQQRRARHYFVGTKHIADYYSASMFEEDVLALLQTDLFPASDIALMGGGSMMYIDAVCNGIDYIPAVDAQIRQRMKDRLAEEGLPMLVDELRRLDYEHWKIVDRNNPRRVIHALEICHTTGKTYTSFRIRAVKERPFDIVKVGINADRATLYANINARVWRMLDAGLVEEARNLVPMRELNALNTVGYKELFAHFDGEITLDEAVRRIQSNTRCYCRKQQTWLKHDESIRWFEPGRSGEVIAYIEERLACRADKEA